MTPSPALAAVFGDVLLCLGAGLMLGALRDAAGLALGDGRGRCFCWDVLTFILAAVVLCGFAAGASGSGVSIALTRVAVLPGWGLARWRGGWGCPMRCTGGCGACCGSCACRCGPSAIMLWCPCAAFWRPGRSEGKINPGKSQKNRKICCKRNARYYIIKTA